VPSLLIGFITEVQSNGAQRLVRELALTLTTRQLQAFSLVAKFKSFARASEQMFMTPSGLSILMRELENQLGFRLFDRTTRQVVLTEHGNALLPVVEQSMRQMQSTIAEISRNAGHRSQRLNVGATPLIAGHVLPSLIARFTADNPSISIRLFDGERGHIVDMVRGGTLDLGVGMFFSKPCAGISRVALHRFSLCVIRSARDVSLEGPSVRWRDLPAERLIQLPPENPIQRLIDECLGKAGHRTLPDVVLNFLETQIAMAETGAGIAIVPSFVRPACAHRQIVMMPLIDPVVGLDLFIIQNRGRQLPAGAAAFTHFVKQSIGEWAEPDPPERLSRSVRPTRRSPAVAQD
jgi:DNA-binding transcriptional LysR family regulator